MSRINGMNTSTCSKLNNNRWKCNQFIEDIGQYVHSDLSKNEITLYTDIFSGCELKNAWNIRKNIIGEMNINAIKSVSIIMPELISKNIPCPMKIVANISNFDKKRLSLMDMEKLTQNFGIGLYNSIEKTEF